MPLGEFGVGSSGGGGGAESMSLVDLVAMELIEWDDADGLSLRRRAVSRENCGDVRFDEGRSAWSTRRRHLSVETHV